MVGGAAAALTAGDRLVQCAETARIARGRGSDRASACHAGPARPGSSINIGEPWEMKMGGTKFMAAV